MIEKDGNHSLSIEQKEEMQVILHTSIDLLVNSIKLNLWLTAPKRATPVN